MLFSYIIISGIFGKRGESLDILPPPPPFPEIGKEYDVDKEAERLEKRERKERKRELE